MPMKKFRIVLVLVLLICGSFASAQFKAFGVKAGINYSESVIKETFTSDGTDFTYATEEADVGLAWGMFARLKLRHFFFQPEVLVSNHNTRMKLSSINLDSISTLNRNRIDIPLLIGYSRKDKIRAFLGPVYTRTIVNEIWTDEFMYEEIRELFKGGTWAFQLGFGFDMGRLAVDARYETNLGALSDKVTIRNYEFAFDHRINTVQVTLGYDFIK
jgi:Outer membrane protein beta-barrel domain